MKNRTPTCYNGKASVEMVQIWQMEPYPCGDPRLPHHVFPPKMITPDELSKRTGTLYWKLDTLDQIALAKRLTTLKLERNFKREDIFTLDAETTANFDDKLEELFEESSTPVEQARMIIEGCAYYDVEDKNGDWVRIFCEYGDLILIPAHTNFRFTTTPRNFVKMRRFYKDETN